MGGRAGVGGRAASTHTRPGPLSTRVPRPPRGCSGYINWSTAYILWLLSAVFYHLPSLQSLGIDARADLSLLLTTFLLTLGVLGVGAGVGWGGGWGGVGGTGEHALRTVGVGVGHGSMPRFVGVDGG